MTSVEIRTWLLDHDLTESDLRRAAEILAHLEHDPEDLAALRDFDRLRDRMRSMRVEAEVPTSAGDWDGMVRQIIATTPRHPTTRWRPLAWAALLLIAVSGWLWRPAPPPATPGSFALNPPAAKDPARQPPQLTKGDIDQQLGVFREVSQVFDRRATWVALAENVSDVGLTSAPSVTDRIVMLRLLMTRGERTVSQADLAIVPGQQAELTVPLDDGRSIQYRIAASREIPTQLSVWAQVDDAANHGAGETLAALATRLYPRPGAPYSAGKLATSGGGYELTLFYAEGTVKP